jgi:hypothetical protein
METIAVGFFTIGGVVLGALLSNRLSRSGQRRAFALEARMHMAELYDVIWGDQPQSRLVVEFEKLRAQLEWLGIQSGSIDELEKLAFECWKSGNESMEHSPDGEPGLEVNLLKRFREKGAQIAGGLPR